MKCDVGGCEPESGLGLGIQGRRSWASMGSAKNFPIRPKFSTTTTTTTAPKAKLTSSAQINSVAINSQCFFCFLSFCASHSPAGRVLRKLIKIYFNLPPRT